ncbi:hypothetical protein [Arthrobacter sp. zg-Y1116]|nr:hypothetical protein [Arthrobacter sp. zg-Y1116]
MTWFISVIATAATQLLPHMKRCPNPLLSRDVATVPSNSDQA